MDEVMVDERTELLINRKLDERLTDEERLELDKRLIRCPEARAMLADLERIDEAAVTALASELGPPANESVAANGAASMAGWRPPAMAGARSARQGRYRFWAMLAASGALAAAVTLVVLLHGSGVVPVEQGPAGDSQMVEAATGDTGTSGTIGPRQGPADVQLVGQDVFGVFDADSQSLYLLELDRRPHKLTANY